MLFQTLQILYYILFTTAAISVAYFFMFAAAGLFYRETPSGFTQSHNAKIAILVPAYREDEIIQSTALNLTHLDYPAALYDIYILADQLLPETVQNLGKIRVSVLEMQFEKSTKSKSLNEAFKRISDSYDIGLILDADNIPAADFLKWIDAGFQAGYSAMQGQRVAKNLDSDYSILDACSESVNNHIFRKGANALGLSSPVIGSGMAFDYGIIKKTMADVNAVGGFDKVVQLHITGLGIKIKYLESALIFDEKVGTSSAFRQQRRRWVSSQFHYLQQFFIPGMRALFRGQLSYFNLAVANNFVLPRAFLLLVIPVLIVMGAMLSAKLLIAAVILGASFIVSLLIALPKKMYNRRLLLALLSLPRAVFIMIGTILHLKSSNKTFLHTKHTTTKVTNPLFSDMINQHSASDNDTAQQEVTKDQKS